MPRNVSVTFADGTSHIYQNVPDDATPDQVEARAQKDFQGKRITGLAREPIPETPAAQTGFIAGVKGGFESLKGDVAALGIPLGVEGAEAAREEYKKKAAQIYKQPELTEAPWEYIKGLAGQSLAYMGAPLAVGTAAAVAAPGAAVAGIGAGALAAFGTSAAQFTGSNISRQIEEKIKPEDVDAMAAIGAAIPQAALDTIGLKYIPGIQRIFKQAGAELTREEAAHIVRNGIVGTAVNTARAYGPSTVKAMGVEGLTEAAQQVFERAQAGLNLTDPEARKEYYDNFIGGAILGGGISIPGRALERSIARGKYAAEDREAARREAAYTEGRGEQLPLGQVPELGEGYEGFRAPPEPARAAEEKEAERQNRLFQITELRDQHDVLMREVDRLKTQFEAAPTDEQKSAILERANELNIARADLEKQIKKLSKGLEGAERAGAVAEPGQMGLDFEAPAMPRQRTGEGVVLGEEEAAPAGITPEQAEFFRQQRIADINARMTAGELVTDAERAFLQMDAREQRALFEARPTPELVVPEERDQFRLGPQYIQPAPTMAEAVETRPVTEADFKAMGVGKTNKKLREAIMGKDLADPEQRAEVQEVLTDFANDPNRSPKLIEGVNNFLSSPVFMQQGELDLRPRRKPRVKKAKEAADVIQPTESIEPAVEPSTAMAGELGAAPPGGITAPVAGGVDVTGGAAQQPDVGAGVQPTALEEAPSEPAIPPTVPPTAAPAMEAPAALTPAEGRVDLNTAISRLMFEGNLKRSEATKLARDIADAYDEVGTQDITDVVQTVKGGKPLYRTRAVGQVGMPAAKVQKLVDNIVSRWKNAPKIQVVQSVEELPDYLQKQITEDQVNPPGAFDPDSETIFLIADNIESDVDAALTLAHEALGHYGLRSILGNSYTKMMDDIYNGNIKVRKQALRKMAEGLDKHTAVEEVLAEMAEQGVYNNAMQRVFNAIRQWLRRMGVDFRKVTDTEVREVLANAQRFVVAGGPKAEGAAAFKGKPLFRTGTDAFKKWFGNSVVRNPDGSPKLMYHGTARDISEFQPKQANAIFVTDDPRFAEGFTSSSEDYMLKELRSKLSEAQLNELYDKADAIAAREGTSPIDEFNNLLSELLPSRANIVPVYVSAQNPFDFQKRSHLNALADIVDDNDLMTDVMHGEWEAIESAAVQEAIKFAGFDGFYVQEGGRKNLAVYDSSQLKSPFNSGAYSREDRRILYRRRKEEPLTTEGQRAAALNERMKGIANEPEPDVDQTFIDRLTLMSEKSKGLPMAIRQAVVDKDAPVKEKLAAAYQNKVTNSLGEIRGDVLNEQAQEATGVADQLMRRGGIRLGKDGLYEVYDRVENGQKISLDAVFEIIIENLGAKLGSAKEAVTLAHRAFIAQRSNEINKRSELLRSQAEAAEAKGNKRAAEKLRKQIIRVRASQAEIDAGLEAMRTFPELKQAFDVFTKYNEGIIDFLVSTGRLSPAQAQDWKDNVGYVPWTRVEEDTNKLESANKLRTGNVHLAELPKLDTEGSSKEIRNVLDNMVGNTISAIRAGLKNRAAIKTLEQLPDAEELKTQDEVDRELKNNKQLVVFAYRDGERVAFRLQNQEDLAAFSNVVDVAGPVLSAFKTAATGLRSFVTHMPTFALSQLVQDTGRAMFLSGVKHPFSLPSKVLSNFYHVVTGGATDIQALGITGAYDGMPDHAMRRARERHGLQERNAFLRAWDKLEDFSLAADMAVRAAIYDQTMQETGDRVLAFHRAKEYINFKTTGNGQTVRILRQIVPFMNAYIQGMDVLYRSLQGKGLSMEDRKTAMALFYTTGAKVAALSLLYAALVGDDDDYKGLDDYERDGNFIIPGTGLKLPVAPEIGFLFKVIPERIYQAIAREGTDRPVDAKTFMRGMRDAAINAYGGVNLTPQLIKPALEVATNYSFFTNNPIVGINMAGKETYLQFNNNTSELAKLFGHIGISPMKVDHLLRGYLGTVGGVILDVTDAVADPNRMSKPVNKLPLVKTFMYDDTGRGYKTEFYAFREDVDKVVNSVNTFKREGRAEELQEYLTEDKLKLYAMKGVVNKIEEQLGSLRRYRNIIANDPDLTPQEKREKTDEVLAREKALLQAYNLPRMKQMAGY